MTALGLHLIADIAGATGLDDCAAIEAALRAAALAAHVTVLDLRLHHFGADCGVTGVVLLAESHISIHTWPEYGFAAVDIFMCGNSQPQRALEVLQLAFDAPTSTVKTIARGLANRTEKKSFTV